MCTETRTKKERKIELNVEEIKYDDVHEEEYFHTQRSKEKLSNYKKKE